MVGLVMSDELHIVVSIVLVVAVVANTIIFSLCCKLDLFFVLFRQDTNTLQVITMTDIACVDTSYAPSHTVLPSYTALKPCALTAKSVVNHKANIDPLLTIGEGSMNPDNLKNKTEIFKNIYFSASQQDMFTVDLCMDAGRRGVDGAVAPLKRGIIKTSTW